MAFRYAIAEKRMAEKKNTDYKLSVDSLALSSPDSRTVGKLATRLFFELQLTLYSYKLAAIKLMTASQEHLEKHCTYHSSSNIH
jgi:hypothetical protein